MDIKNKFLKDSVRIVFNFIFFCKKYGENEDKFLIKGNISS